MDGLQQGRGQNAPAVLREFVSMGQPGIPKRRIALVWRAQDNVRVSTLGKQSESPDRKLPILVGHYDRDARRTPECPCHAAVPTRDPAWAGAMTAARHANAAVQRPSTLAAPGDPRSVAANAVAL